MTGTVERRSVFYRATDGFGGAAEVPARGILIPFFSHTGRTKRVAGVIHELTGGELFEIRGKKPYPKDYYRATAVARKEKEARARPRIQGPLPDLAGYGTVFLGYPNWWYDMPMIIYTFLEELDFYHKTLIPFCTSAGTGLSHTVSAITKLTPGATVLEGLAVGESKVNGASVMVTEWLSRLGYLPAGA
jgi:flavodoxin